MRRVVLAAVVAAFSVTACEPAGQGNVLEIEGTSVVQGFVFVDANASGDFENSDQAARSIAVALVRTGTSDTIARTTTNDGGSFSFALVPVGRYDVVVPATALGDSMSVVYRDPPGESVEDIESDDTTSVVIGVIDTATVRIGIAYPTHSVAEARALPEGRRIFVRAVALTGIGAAGDSSLYVQGDSVGLRATRLTGGGVSAGDSVRLIGTTASRDGQPILRESSATVEETGAAFDTIVVDAATARDAGGGRYDAMLVRVPELTITDTTRAGGRFVMTAEDPSGTVDLSIPLDGISPEYVPGAELSAIGVLVPRPNDPGVWQIRPRSAGDVVIRDP